MKEYLKSYQACLKVEGPVFIGNGRKMTKKEYIFLKGGSQIGVLDMPAFYAFLGRKRLQHKFDDFMLYDYRSDLHHWLQDQRIPDGEVEPYFRYVLDTGDIQRVRNTQVMEFIKDPYGCPYVPGSSIKGMLRTILLADKILSHPRQYAAEINGLYRSIPDKKNKRLYLKREIAQLENRAFHTLDRKDTRMGDAVNDALSGLIISDSAPLEVSSLILCQKYDRNPAGIEKPLPLMRECLRPGTEIHFTMTIDENRFSVNGEQMMAAVNDFLRMYNKDFLSKFRGVKLADQDTIYLGGGTGFATKTAIYPAFGGDDSVGIIADIFKNTGVPYKHGHANDRQQGVSPHIVKYTYYRGKRYQMGACKLSIVLPS